MKSFLKAATTGMAVMGAMVFGASTAAAAPGDVEPFAYSDCPDGRMCLFDGDGGAGLIVPTLGRCGLVNFGSLNPPRNDRANSVRNRTGRTAYLYNHISSGQFVLIEVVGAGAQRNLPAEDKNRVDQVAVDC
jgi:peptidase inhibitor family I36